MSELDQIVGAVPMEQVAVALGVDRDQAEAAVRTALPALLGGLQANAADPAGATSLGAALSAHDGSALGADLGSLDLGDGERIVGHIFGGNTSDVVAQLGGVRGAGGSGVIGKLLPILAPIVLAYLSTKLKQQGGLGGVLGGSPDAGSPDAGTPDAGSPDAGAAPQPSGPLIPPPGPGRATPAATGSADAGPASGGGLGDILGQILGGGSSGGSGGAGGDILGGILGGLLGGGRR